MNNISRTARTMNYLRTGGARTIGYVLSIGMVAGVAARVSYSHIRDITLFAGQPTDVAAVLPLSVDGMLMAASLAMAEDKAKGREPRLWARIGFWFGAVISLACNAASTIVRSTLTEWGLAFAVFVSMLAPALLLITVEIIVRPGKPRKTAEVTLAPERRVKTDEERLEAARQRAGYYDMDAAGKAKWTRERNDREAKRIARNAPQSPAWAVKGEPTAAELEAANA